MATRHSAYPRAKDEFYSEPSWVADALLDHLPLKALHDPCCGFGTIITAATRRGIRATGADIVDRACGLFSMRDFLSDETIYPAIVCNPPFKIAATLIAHALTRVPDQGHVAMLSPISFLAAQRRYALFSRPELDEVLVLSKRPSAPPGDLLLECGESMRKSGSFDFVWTIWQRGRRPSPPQIRWTLGPARRT
jgi:hypothetical protein